MFVLETERARAILTKFLIPGDQQILLASYGQYCFLANFGGHLEFLRKTQKHVYHGNGGSYSNFDENLDPQGICRLYWRLFAKMVLLPLLVTILNFCVKHKNVFILETERARVILMKCLTHGVSAVYW